MINLKKAPAFLSAALLCALLAAGCSSTLVNLSYENNQMYNKRLKLVYDAAPLCYEPVSVGDAYAYYGDGDLVLYEISGFDPKEWLTEAYAGTMTTIFHTPEITLPTLPEMDTDQLYICSNTEINFSLKTVEDKEAIRALVETFENGEEAPWPSERAETSYNLKFYSEEHPQFYYNLIYAEYPTGNILYERISRHCVYIGSMVTDLLDG